MSWLYISLLVMEILLILPLDVVESSSGCTIYTRGNKTRCYCNQRCYSYSRSTSYSRTCINNYSSLYAWIFISIVSLLIIACLLIAIGYSKCFKGTKTQKIYPKITIVAPKADSEEECRVSTVLSKAASAKVQNNRVIRKY
ncbi:uncharacterized protein LOC111114511 [Crassostrea virginica]